VQILIFSFALLGVFLVSGLWVAPALGITGILFLYTNDLSALRVIGNITWKLVTDFTITAIPLFLFMGEIIINSGISKNFYKGIAKYVKKIPGGMLISNIVACAIFAAISGSSPATEAAIGSVAIPEMKLLGYKKKYIYGSLASGGTLGILIPPSIALIIYGALTSQSVVQLFTAAIVPGIILALIYITYLIIFAAFVKKEDFKDVNFDIYGDFTHLQAIKGIVPLVFLIAVVLGSIYRGVATPTEAAGLGASLALVMGFILGDLNVKKLWVSLSRAGKTTAMIFAIFLGAQILSYVMSSTGSTHNLVKWMIGLNLSKGILLVLVYSIYIFLGCFIDGISIMFLTLPVLFPVLMGYGFDPIWFGIVLVILIEMGLITPPMGINLFVIKGIDKEADLNEVIAGVIPYFFLMLLMLLILTFFPSLATFVL